VPPRWNAWTEGRIVHPLAIMSYYTRNPRSRCARSARDVGRDSGNALAGPGTAGAGAHGGSSPALRAHSIALVSELANEPHSLVGRGALSPRASKPSGV
jgi:hypothetical protein